MPDNTQIYIVPEVGPERHTVCRGTVDAVGVKAFNRRFVIGERPGNGNRVAHRRLLDVGRDNPYITEFARDLGQSADTGAVDTVIVRD